MYIRSYHLFGELPRINRKLAPAYNRKTRKAYMRINKKWARQFEEMVVQLTDQRDETSLTCPVDVLIYMTIQKAEDSDAPVKGMLDAMETAGVYENDNQVWNLFIIRNKDDEFKEDYARIELYQQGDLAFFYDKGVSEWLKELSNAMSPKSSTNSSETQPT